MPQKWFVRCRYTESDVAYGLETKPYGECSVHVGSLLLLGSSVALY